MHHLPLSDKKYFQLFSLTSQICAISLHYHESLPIVKRDDYEFRQDAHDREYRQAWKDNPDFALKAGKSGILMDADGRESSAMPFEEATMATSYLLDMADALDTHVDRCVEKFGYQNEKLIREVADFLKLPMEIEIEKNRALLLGRTVSTLLDGGPCKVMAKIHGLLHAIPGLAKHHNISSMTQSAKMTGTSKEWISQMREKWCYNLAIPIPSENRKSQEAIEKYRAAQKANHWRRRSFVYKNTENDNTSCKLKPITLKSS